MKMSSPPGRAPNHCEDNLSADDPQVGVLYAVQYRDTGEWHLAVWDGDCYALTDTQFQSGDRWQAEWVRRTVYVAEYVS